ncbi:MAG: hypothetical protein NTY19_48215 [Planctomycetota bacterium]|nr:hypothetical protein [Planctomycetota bacterium]
MKVSQQSALWGGIGGSGKHGADLQPEVPERAPWGGIGGSGKHGADLQPEARS